MADITISDLELAPALTDDMVLPVENTTDTYAATLAMLRRLINKTFVEVEDADFNALTDDGFYQCTGTPTNSPEAGAINWTLQVSAESGVVVQRAFSLDDNFANLYIRRWNGVTWTAWIEVGAGALANKANTDASNFTATGKQNVVGWGMPDYSTEVMLSSSQYVTTISGGGYTVPYDCIMIGGATDKTIQCFADELEIYYQDDVATGKNSQSPLFILPEGTIFRATNSFDWLKMLKLKGVN